MATNYTTILKLALPTQGENSGTWGDLVNDNITSMIEEAIAGRKVINTWTTNSHTLTTADGTTSESRAAMLEFTDTGSALTGAGSVICPAQSKIYVAKNNTGSQAVTLKTSSGTGISIPDGETMLLFCDGTNVEQAVTNIASAKLGGETVTLGGTLTTADAFTTSGAYSLTLTATAATNVTLPTSGTLSTLAGTETLTNKTLTSPAVGTAMTMNGRAELRFGDGDTSNYIGFEAPATVSSNQIWVLPDSDGSANQVIETDGSGNLSWVDQSSGDVVDDTTPQLGGNLDVNGNSIVSTSNGNINITPNGSGNIVLDGLTFPNADGSADQVLKTDGSGTLSFVDQSSGGSGVPQDADDTDAVSVTGTNSMAIGSAATATATRSTAIGMSADATGERTTAVGQFAEATANEASAFGYDTLSSAIRSTSVGYQAEATATASLAIGWRAKSAGIGSVVIGNYSQTTDPGDYTIHIGTGGYFCGNSDSVTAVVGGSNQMGNGTYYSGDYAESTFVGSDMGLASLSGSGTGVRTTFVGHDIYLGGAHSSTDDCSENTAVGSDISINDNANGNTCMGHGVRIHADGKRNVAIGFQTAVGEAAGDGGEDNVAIGTDAFIDDYRDNSMALGHDANATVSNQIVLGNSSITDLRCQDTSITAVSDERDKIEIEDLTIGLDFVNEVTPKSFYKNNRGQYFDKETREFDQAAYEAGEKKNERLEFGWIAQHVEAALEETSGYEDARLTFNEVEKWKKEEGEEERAVKMDVQRFTPGDMVPILWKAVQELSAKNDELEARLAALES